MAKYLAANIENSSFNRNYVRRTPRIARLMEIVSMALVTQVGSPELQNMFPIVLDCQYRNHQGGHEERSGGDASQAVWKDLLHP